MKKIEIITWYKCNCRCSFCSSSTMKGDGFSAHRIAELLSEYRKNGVSKVDFGGGEPTVRTELPALARAAVALGYSSVGVKSNGMRFCYPEYVGQCMESGINEYSISIWGYPAEMHDRMAGRTGAFEMTEMGLKHLVDSGADVCVDYLMTKQSLETLTEAIGHLGEKVGVKKIRLWLFSVFGAGGRGNGMLPSLKDAGRAAAAAYSANKNSVDWVKTSHIPPCLLPDLPSMYFDIRELGLMVITPGHSFTAEESPFEKGVHVSQCLECRLVGACAGPREEYVRFRGGHEVVSVK